MPLAPHYHVGIVVPNLAAARRQLADRLGVRWGPVMHLDRTAYRAGDGRDLDLPTTICYSADEPSLELIEEVPGSVWECNEHSNLHHIGFWSDDLAGDSAGLAEAGCPMQICGRSGAEAPVSFAYHLHGLGVRIELVDRSMRDAMAFLFRPDES